MFAHKPGETIGANTLSYYHNSQDYVVGHVFMIKEKGAQLKKDLRITNQRRVIIDTVFDTEEHFTADQLLDWARERDSSVSRATVYRTLPLLTESNLVHEMDFGKPYKFYDPNYSDSPNHNHLICEDCEKIVEFDSDRIEQIENEIGQKLGFTVKSQNLQLTAACDTLKRNGACDKKTCS